MFYHEGFGGSAGPLAIFGGAAGAARRLRSLSRFAGEGWGGGGSASHTVRVERAPTRKRERWSDCADRASIQRNLITRQFAISASTFISASGAVTFAEWLASISK